MLYCGICGSDMHFYKDGEPEFVNLYPFIIGHEGSGEIVAVGDRVTHVQVGDRVAIEPGIPCRVCEWCTSGRYHLCDKMVFLSAPRANGVMREYISHPADLCHKLPDTVSAMEGALIEPLAVGMSAAAKSGIGLGHSAAILGAGCVGLLTMLSLRARGVTDITVVDLFANRLDKANELGATRVINAHGSDPAAEVRSAFRDLGPDYVFETAGSMHAAKQTVPMVKRGGKVVIIGNIVGQIPVDFQLATNKEVDILTNFRYHNVHPLAIGAVASGQIDLRNIVSRVYRFEQTPQAFEDCIEHRDTMVKAMLKIALDA
jgi:L-iditol 2-dehydrogenase